MTIDLDGVDGLARISTGGWPGCDAHGHSGGHQVLQSEWRCVNDEYYTSWAESGARERGIAGRVFTSFGPAAYVLLVLLILGGLLANTAGKAKASTQKAFFVFASDPNKAVIRMYADTIVAVRFDRVKKTLTEEVVIQKISTEGIALTFEKNVGLCHEGNLLKRSQKKSR